MAIKAETRLFADPRISALPDPDAKLRTLQLMKGTRADLEQLRFPMRESVATDNFVLGASSSGNRRIILEMSRAPSLNHYWLWLEIHGFHIHGIYRVFHSHQNESPITQCFVPEESGYLCIRGMKDIPGQLFALAYYSMENGGNMDPILYAQSLLPEDQRSLDDVKTLLFAARVPPFRLYELPRRLNYQKAMESIVDWFTVLASDPELFEVVAPNVVPTLQLYAE